MEGAAGGSIDASGLYTAPMVSGTFHVVATSQADGTTQGSATVAVTRPPPGTLDVTFGDGGIVVMGSPFDGGYLSATTLHVSGSDEILVGGGISPAQSSNSILVSFAKT